MAKAKLKIEVREEGKNPRQLRASGNLPGSLYGKNIDAKNLSCPVSKTVVTNKFLALSDGPWQIIKIVIPRVNPKAPTVTPKKANIFPINFTTFITIPTTLIPCRYHTIYK